MPTGPAQLPTAGQNAGKTKLEVREISAEQAASAAKE